MMFIETLMMTEILCDIVIVHTRVECNMRDDYVRLNNCHPQWFILLQTELQCYPVTIKITKTFWAFLLKIIT